MVQRRGEYRFWWEGLREGDQLEHPGIDGRIILNRSFKK